MTSLDGARWTLMVFFAPYMIHVEQIVFNIYIVSYQKQKKKKIYIYIYIQLN